MDELLSSQDTLEMDADFEATWNGYMAEMARLNDLMRQDQVEIDRLKAESDVLRAESQALKAESHVLRADTRAILDRLKQQYKSC